MNVSSYRCPFSPDDYLQKMPFDRFWLVEKRSVVTEDIMV